MPEPDPRSTYDTSILKSEPRKPITLESQKAHEDALEMKVPIPDLVEVLKTLVPGKAEALDAKLLKYQAGKFKAQGAYTLIKTDVGPDKMITAFEKLAPGYDRIHVLPICHPHPIVV